MYQKRLFGRAFLCIFCMGSSLVAPIVQATPLAADAGHTDIQHTDIVDPDAALSLHDVVEKAYARNPTQPILAARMAEVRARRTVATSLLPQAPAVGMSAQNDAVGSGRGERDWQAELELPVWLQGQRNARKNVADAADEDLAASRDSLKLQVAGYVREAIWDIRMNANALELADLRLNTAMALEHDVQRRYEAGELAKTDLMLAQNERIIAETGRLRAEAELMHARHRYIILTGLHTMPQQLDEAQSAQEDYSEQHPYYREAMSRLGLTQQARELARLERRENPQVILNARSRGGIDEAAALAVRRAVGRAEGDACGAVAGVPSPIDVTLRDVHANRLHATATSPLHLVAELRACGAAAAPLPCSSTCVVSAAVQVTQQRRLVLAAQENSRIALSQLRSDRSQAYEGAWCIHRVVSLPQKSAGR